LIWEYISFLGNDGTHPVGKGQKDKTDLATNALGRIRWELGATLGEAFFPPLVRGGFQSLTNPRAM